MEKLTHLLTDDEKRRLKIVHLHKNEILFNEGDQCLNIGLVFRGELKIVSYLENGVEIIYNIIKEQQMFGNNLIFSSDPTFRGDVIANTESYLYLIPKERLLELLRENQEFLIGYLNAQSDFGKSLNLNIKLLTLNNAKERVLYYLKTNKDKIDFKSITDLAKQLFLTREVLSRTLHNLEREHIISIKDKTIIKI